MVDTQQIRLTLNEYFEMDSDIRIDPETGVVDVQGVVFLRKSTPQLPVQFGRTHFFFCEGNGLTTLKGAPIHVDYNFWCQDNNLTSLSHAPQFVGGDFRCNNNLLEDLQGAPDHVASINCLRNPLKSLMGMPNNIKHGVFLDYHAQLPLLRCLQARSVDLRQSPDPKITQILNKYVGKGKPGALKAAAELLKAGYKENARW